MVSPPYLVAVGGVIGAILRHLVSQTVDGDSFPFGTFTVNVVGSFVLGLVVFFQPNNDVTLLVGTGICGSFTTFSSFSFTTVRLWETNERWTSIGFAVANLIGALTAVGIAWLVVATL